MADLNYPEAAVVIHEVPGAAGTYAVVYVQARSRLSKVLDPGSDGSIDEAIDQFEAPINRETVEQLVAFWIKATGAARTQHGVPNGLLATEYHFGINGQSGWILGPTQGEAPPPTSATSSCPQRLVTIAKLLGSYASALPKDRATALMRVQEEAATTSYVDCECACLK